MATKKTTIEASEHAKGMNIARWSDPKQRKAAAARMRERHEAMQYVLRAAYIWAKSPKSAGVDLSDNETDLKYAVDVLLAAGWKPKGEQK